MEMMSELTISNRTVGDILILDLIGELDDITVEPFRRRLKKAIADGHRKIILNGAKLSFINSKAIGILLTCLRDVKEFRGNMALAALSERVRRIFELIGGCRLIDIFSTEQEAIVSLLGAKR